MRENAVPAKRCTGFVGGAFGIHQRMHLSDPVMFMEQTQLLCVLLETHLESIDNE
jgi:hypothetical protein